MTEHFIFSDASFDSKSRKGVIATLIVAGDRSFEIQTKQIDGETIARLEFLSAIDALRQWKSDFSNESIAKLTLVIDCKAIENLLQRREKLEKTCFFSQSKKKILANADLYQEFLALYDELRPDILWVKGHAPQISQSTVQKIFAMVDKSARKKLREAVK